MVDVYLTVKYIFERKINLRRGKSIIINYFFTQNILLGSWCTKYKIYLILHLS